MITDEQEFFQRVADLQQALDDAEPGLAGHVQKIHQDLQKMPELVHVLTDEQIAVIVSGLRVQSGISITTAKPKAKKAKLADLEI